ncbi:S-adenosyl-L-methionine-dependent methyltransferase [Aspergillus fijiensis CBS 313.89]|uniref:S-adenosyl-L-methionine-dependent methyltransferase n=1 Tax=Aspergillus fijiensis CBS 313.89 TaxID=1448319 RepID=A0A8G1RIC8_9EURO|nr:S-adenosyl-L-methionine-dependent methyltransferase [Aspergillus fijiensis CBS 313.89]RAK70971.1 S-adenosyl-L-methionine-dependent methyltransferase [Aspergillus fijiensis CBS 313.89]
MNPSRIVELATRIQGLTKEIDSHLRENNLPAPSFEENGPVELGLSGHMLSAREEVLSSTLELHDLFLGPSNCLRPVLNGVSLQAIYRFDIARHVPVNGEISFRELAEKCGFDEANLRRTLRFAMAYHHVFHEPRKGFVAHTAASRRLVDDPTVRAGLGYMFEEVWQGFAHKGNVSSLVAQDYPELQFIVQDLPSMIVGAAESLPNEVRDRMSFQAHDFFTPQPVRADAYLFRNIFPNWSDSPGVRILQALIPALRPGAWIIVNDYLLPEPGLLSLVKERAVRNMDMIMFTLSNSRERKEADWVELFRKADSRFAN